MCYNLYTEGSQRTDFDTPLPKSVNRSARNERDEQSTGSDQRPVSLKELRDTVNALLERKSVSVFKNEEEKDEIILLTDRKSVLFNGNKICLTPNEFLLLERLLERQGCPVSREEINTLLCADGNTSDVYICMLRKKLTHNRRSPVITIRGKGYMIE